MALTSIPGINDSLLGKSLFLGKDAQLGPPTVIVTASNSVTFSQTNNRTNSSIIVVQPISFSQSNAVQIPIHLTANNSIVITQLAASSILTRPANNTIAFILDAQQGEEIGLTASNILTMAQVADSNILTRTASDTLPVIQFANRIPVITTAIPLTADDSINFSQTNNRILFKVAAIVLTSSHSLTFSHRAIFPIELTSTNTVLFTDTDTSNAGKNGADEITFVQTIVANHFRSLTASDTLNISHAFTWVQLRNNIPILGEDKCSALYEYAPYSGGDGTPIVRPVAPVLIKKSDVFFFYPSGPICDATNSITLRTPNFGDRDRNQYNRINRESRGGSLQIFRDQKWPSQRVLVMDFSGVKDSEIDGILIFLETTLGQKVGFRDWQGRVWMGIITTPDATITKTGNNRNDIAIELEVDNLLLELNACSSLAFSQTNIVVQVP